jgi:mRNA interferase MazF
VIRRGDIFWGDLGIPQGSAPGYRRPVVVVQSDAFNRSRIATVLVAVLTSNLDLARAPGNVLLPRSASKLEKDSVINISQILTLDKDQLDPKAVSHLPKALLEDLGAGLRLVLGIDP